MARGLIKSPQISSKNIIIAVIVKTNTYLIIIPRKCCVDIKNRNISIAFATPEVYYPIKGYVAYIKAQKSIKQRVAFLKYEVYVSNFRLYMPSK